MVSNTRLTLNLQYPNIAQVAYAMQGDRLSRAVVADLIDGSTPWTPPDGAYGLITASKPDGTFAVYDTLEDGSPAIVIDGSTVTLYLAEQVLADAGAVKMSVAFFTAAGARLTTFRWTEVVAPEAVLDRVVSGNYISILTATMAEAAEIFQQIKAAYGAPLTANTAAAMTDTSRVYVYTGTTGGGFTNGHWYYWDGTAWVDGGNYNSTGFTTDTTLTIAGAAADAKATGDAIGDLKSTLNSVETGVFYDTTINRGVNLFNRDDSRNKDGYYRNSSGVLTPASSTEMFVSHPIAVKGGITYKTIRRPGTFGNANQVFITDFSGDNVLDIFEGTVNGNYFEFTPVKDCLVVLNLGRDSGGYTPFLKNNCMVCKADEYPSSDREFVPYITNTIKNYSNQAKIQLSEIEGVINGNLFDINSAGNISNANIASAGITTVEGYYVSHPIFLKAGKTYIAKRGAGTGSNMFYMALDKDLNPLVNFSRAGEEDMDYSDCMTIEPDVDGFYRINLGKDPSIVFICERGDYNGYYRTFGTVIPHLKSERLYGKIVTFNGDSICAGAGFSGGYGKIIAENNGMIYENIAVNGGTIAGDTYYESGQARHWICRTIDQMRGDADYIILEGGANDSVDQSIGAISNGYDGPFDDTTYAGAFESMIYQAVNRWPGKKIGYIAVHQCSSGYRVINSNHETSRYWLAKDICAKWGIPFCDLNVNVPALGYLSNLKSLYTKDGDGWHPNKAGYLAYYVPIIEAWMASL